MNQFSFKLTIYLNPFDNSIELIEEKNPYGTFFRIRKREIRLGLIYTNKNKGRFDTIFRSRVYLEKKNFRLT